MKYIQNVKLHKDCKKTKLSGFRVNQNVMFGFWLIGVFLKQNHSAYMGFECLIFYGVLRVLEVPVNLGAWL